MRPVKSRIFWSLIDRVVSRWLAIEPLSKDGASIISIEHRKHRGKSVLLDDDTVVTAGDSLIELHMNNEWFVYNREKFAGSPGGLLWKSTAAFTDDLRALAGQLTDGRLSAEIKALHGTTTLYASARYLGFTITEIPGSLRKCLTTFYLRALRRTYGADSGRAHKIWRKPPVIKEVWMSKSKLIEKYGPKKGY